MVNVMKHTDTVEEARGHVDRWTDEVTMLEAEIAAGEKTMGARAFLKPKSLAGSARALAERRDQLTGAQSALDHARWRLAQLERQGTLAEIVRLRARAEELFEAANRHQVRTRALLSEAAKHEAVEAWSSQPEGHRDRHLNWVVPPTKSDQLRSDARLLLVEADNLEAKLNGVRNYHHVSRDLVTGFLAEYRGR
jgi:hypothetical protein